MAWASEVKRYLVEHLAGRQSLIAEQAVSAIRSSREILSAERLTDQELMDHFPQLFGDLVKYFLTDADPGARRTNNRSGPESRDDPMETELRAC